MAGAIRRLLFVANDRDAVDFCAAVAEPFGFIVRRAGSRAAMEEAIGSFGPDAVLLDPETDDGQVLAGVRQVAGSGASLMLVGPPESHPVKVARSLAAELGIPVAGVLATPLVHEGIEAALRALVHEGPEYGPDDIAEAVMRGDITAWYQPQLRRFDKGWRIDGAEALARWVHPQHGVVLPDAFIPTAEAEGQIAAITDCVLRTAMEQVAAWRNAGLDLRACVKLTPDLVTDPDFPDRLHTLLREYDAAPGSLVIQMPEARIASVDAGFRSMLVRLRVLGFGLALEHFGVGTSSLTELYQTPFGELKLDQRVTARLPDDQDARRFVRAILALSRELGLAVTAEAVETREALAALHDFGCDRAQGYAISRPLPAPEFQGLVKRWNETGLAADLGPGRGG